MGVVAGAADDEIDSKADGSRDDCVAPGVGAALSVMASCAPETLWP